LLYGPLPSQQADFALQIFNPDGSEAEKSGNGLRIFARYLFDTGRIGAEACPLETAGGLVQAQVDPNSTQVRVAMGRVSFHSQAIPVAGPPRQVLREPLTVGGETVVISAATVGNPHCVVEQDSLSAAAAHRLGPLLETHPHFPQRTNVQFMQVLSPTEIALEIWERGAGYTLASGSSSCAAAAVAHRLGLCGAEVSVRMPGGVLQVSLGPQFEATLQGPVQKVFTAQVWLGL
jgi:diaminopimelate epimerase